MRFRGAVLRLILGLILGLGLGGCGPDDPANLEWREAFDASSRGWLLSAWGPDDSDRVYAVGGMPLPSVDTGEGFIMARDGENWSALELPPGTPLLNWMIGFGDDNLFVAGNQGTVLHWDGSAWSTMDTPTEEQLWGIWGSAPDDLWAVGGGGRAESEATLLHYDGAAWTSVMAPELDRETHAFFKVWGTGANDVIVVGQRGVVLRYDGSDWRQELVGTGQDLISLWGTGPDRIAIVGGRSNGVIVTWDGSEWHTENLSPLPGLNGVWMGNDNVVHAVGVEGTLATISFDERTWTEAMPTTRMVFHAVFGDRSGRLTAVGGNLASPSAPFEGIAYTRELGANE